ncbi:MAG: CDP-alcohol phosphatidyltransferase family protein [Rhodothermales bacterium]|nr:CDP-alcohol phosphatidyltransferase family protein [Rhodothermales bacterium]
MKHVPNALSAIRIVVTPILIWLLSVGGFAAYAWALTLFVLASISDWLDGRLARRFRAKTRIGQFLDPFADKVLVLGTFITLSVLMPERIAWMAVALLALRDLAVTGLRSWMESKGRSLTTRGSAKLKTAAQLTFLITLLTALAVSEGGATFIGPGLADFARAALDSAALIWVLWIVVGVTLITGFQYFLDVRHDDPSA